ncbi:hypothetical protein ENBRE01_1046 [Enteropsectra breve]|nr:hypothetical protein ENBRE01_1046 [Enteropsectra breve]
MNGFEEEKKDSVNSDSKNIMADDNIIKTAAENPGVVQPGMETLVIGFIRKVNNNLNDYKIGWFIFMCIIDAIVIDVDLICDFANRGEKIMPICGLLIILAINLIGIADFKLGSYKVGLLSVTFFEVLLLGLMELADSRYIHTGVIFPLVVTNVVCGLLQLIHACFATPKAAPIDI